MMVCLVDDSSLTVSLDLDGTCYPLADALSSWWAAHGYTPVLPSRPTRWHWWRDVGITDDAFRRALTEFGDDGGYRASGPYEDAQRGITALFDAGFDLVAATSRPATREVVASTYGWVADWFLPLRSVHIGPGSKLEVECDVHVDDDPVALGELSEAGEAVGLLLDRPWNRDAVGFPRVGWVELPTILVGLMSKLEGVPVSERRWELAGLVECLID